jgi:hypothetical protein
MNPTKPVRRYVATGRIGQAERASTAHPPEYSRNIRQWQANHGHPRRMNPKTFQTNHKELPFRTEICRFRRKKAQVSRRHAYPDAHRRCPATDSREFLPGGIGHALRRIPPSARPLGRAGAGADC